MFKPRLSSGSSKVVDVSEGVQKYTIVSVLALFYKCF